MQVGFITTYIQSVPITTNVVSWNSTQASLSVTCNRPVIFPRYCGVLHQ